LLSLLSWAVGADYREKVATNRREDVCSVVHPLAQLLLYPPREYEQRLHVGKDAVVLLVAIVVGVWAERKEARPRSQVRTWWGSRALFGVLLYSRKGMRKCFTNIFKCSVAGALWSNESFGSGRKEVWHTDISALRGVELTQLEMSFPCIQEIRVIGQL